MYTTLTRLAVIPGLVIIVYIYGKDKVEKEPIGLIGKLILYGMCCCFVAANAERLVSAFLPNYPAGSLGYALTNAFLVAALCEEAVKLLALRIGAWNNSHFNYRFDGIVYGVSVAVGFAVLENVMYVMQYGFTTAVVRAFTAVPLHAFCGAVMGIHFSQAKKAAVDGHSATRMVHMVAAYLMPFLIHGIYDAFAMMRSQVASTCLFAFVIFLYITVTKMINRMSQDDRNGGFYRRGGIDEVR